MQFYHNTDAAADCFNGGGHDVILEYNLQFFAQEGPGGEKTEEPTAKKKSDTRKDGKVPKSKELSNGVELIALFLILKFWVGHMGQNFMELFSEIYEKMPAYTTYWGGNIVREDYRILINSVYLELLKQLLPFFLVGIFIAVGINMLQFKFQISTKPLKPKFSKLNPVSGAKRLISKDKIIELLKSIVKVVLIMAIVYSTIKGDWVYLVQFYGMPLNQAIELIGNVVINMGLKISLVFMIVAFADLFYQRYKFKNDIKMTKQEVKDEYKNAEGDPQIKGKIRNKMREASQRRMMQDVPKADVVITNPTHYAVAIRYDAAIGSAPVVLAKGADYVAQKIKEIARESNVEIVENKPLARMLYANVDIGQEVPPELYQAVAEVLAMVYKMQGKI
ncbi:MAG: flagellar biosynthesis protein FlhB [Lachnospiraceae bacterium]|nr:flagellar biosynthesis protein FlhB [Lachnospiraceae bacterium]